MRKARIRWPRIPHSMTQLKAALFSTHGHPSRVIKDRRVLARYQRSRVMVALLGGLVGFFGLGLTFSLSGFRSFTPELEGPTILGLAGTIIAVFLVWFRLWPVVRWVAAAALVVVPLLLSDLERSWQIGLGVAGIVLSLILASFIFLLTSTVRAFPRLLRRGFVGAVAFGFALTLFPLSSADAQVSSCQDTTLTIAVTNSPEPPRTWPSPGDDSPLEVDITSAVTELSVQASSEFEFGSLIVELVSTRPIPLFSGDDPVVVWNDTLRAGSDGRGMLEQTDVEITRRPGENIRLVVEERDVDLGIDAGEGFYRATFTDAFNSENTCELTGRIRITASPHDTPTGEPLVLATTALLAICASAIHGFAGSFRDQEHDPNPPGRLFSLNIELSIDEEDERDLEKLTFEDARLRSIVIVGSKVSVGDRWVVPVSFRSDPRHVDLDQMLLSSSMTLEGEIVGTITLDRTKVTVGGLVALAEPLAVIDLTDPKPAATETSTVRQT